MTKETEPGTRPELLKIMVTERLHWEAVIGKLSKDQYVGIGGVQDIYVVYDYKIDRIFVSFLGADLSEVRGWFEKSGVRVDGILGSDFLERHNCKIDFTKNILYYNGN